jgi:16S rRNA (adenine1518-N6/adenine1519-N6)-dimethyltransferase
MMSTFGKRRALGQHFLKSQTIVQKIVNQALQHAQQNQSASLLEIGPGKGAITESLLQNAANIPTLKKFLIVERDRELVKLWKERTLAAPVELQVVESDFLEVPNSLLFQHTPLTVVSNLPYSVGTAIVERLARFPTAISGMVLMFQAEVAQRIRAQEGQKGRGSLSIWIQNHWEVSPIVSVPPQSFSPPPEVNSEVILLTRRHQPLIPGTEFNSEGDSDPLWQKLLKLAFAHRRKMLRGILPWQNVFDLSGVDGTKRAEALTWQEWNHLYQAVREVSVKPSTEKASLP